MAEPEAAAPPAGRIRAGWPVALGFVAVVVLRWTMSLDARFPRVVADEPAYLAMARLMAGGERWDLGLASTYGPAYSVLLAPWFALGLSGQAVYRAAIVTNIALAGLTFLAFVALARRLLGLDRATAAGLAAVAASLPALVATTNLAWSDDLAPLAFAVLVLVLARAVERPDVRSAAVLVAVTVGCYAVHGRFLPLAPIVAAVLVLLAAARRLPARIAAGGVVAIVVGLGVVQVGSAALYDRLYDPQHVTQGINQAYRIFRLPQLTLSGMGQVWAIVVTTGGLAGIGAVAMVRRVGPAWRATAADADAATDSGHGRLHRLAEPAVLMTVVLPVLIGMALLVSSVFMTDRPRADHMVYGRYNDLFTGPLVLWGGAALVTAGARLRTALTAIGVGLVTGVTAVFVWRYRRGVLDGQWTVYPVLGLVALDPEGPRAVPAITVVALVLLALLTVVALVVPSRARTAAVVVVAGVLCVAGSQRAVDRIDTSRSADVRDAAVIDEVMPPGQRLVWVVNDPDNPLGRSYYRDQLYIPDNPSVRRAGTPWDSGEPFVMAGARRPEPAAAGYRLAWVEPGTSLGLWVAPGPRQDELAAAGELLDDDGFGADPQADEGSVRFVDGPSVGDQVRGTVEVTRPTGAPWPTVSPGGGDPTGRIRVAVVVEGARCGCVLLNGRADVGRWVRGDEDRFTVDVDVDLDAPEDEELSVTVQLVREGVGPFGPPATVTPG